jgi:DNA (cytosine-5)-methyltransferase 1
MRYLSVCSGIEAATVAWHPLGWRAAAFSEIEPFPRAVLQHHYPSVPLHGDFTTIRGEEYGAIDLLVGGTPCQAFSVAGLRKGFADERGNLTLEYLRLAQRAQPRWVVWENVPGVLSIDGGRAFGAFLGGLAQLGYGFAYRVLDAQFFGVPQRRRRVFVVGYIGDWRRAAAVLFERESLSGNPPPRREARQGVASSSRDGLAATLGAKRDGGWRGDLDNETYVADVVGSLCADTHPGAYSGQDAYTGRLVAHALRAEGFDASEDGTGRGTPLVPVAYRTSPNCGAWETGERTDALTTATDPSAHLIAFSSKDHGADAGDTAPTLRAMGHSGSHANAGDQVAVAFNMHKSGNEASSLGISEDKTDCLRAFEKSPFAVMPPASAVRRLTPRECERLQGFPDDYTLIPVRGKPAADGPRYKALGNSMAVPVMRWIGERIQMVEAIAAEREAA